jgi:hypothetical protein
VEIHRMDRHLIYPAGWEHRRREGDWDADPSLKGCVMTKHPNFPQSAQLFRLQCRKVVPIQGTSITLDSPDLLEAWLAERKKRWPTSIRVEERSEPHSRNKRTGDLHHRGSTRRSVTTHRRAAPGDKRLLHLPKNHLESLAPSVPSTKTPTLNPIVDASSSSSSDDEDGPPQSFPSKVPSLSYEDPHLPSPEVIKDQMSGAPQPRRSQTSGSMKPPVPRQARKPFNPFLPSPSLLRNVSFPCTILSRI